MEPDNFDVLLPLRYCLGEKGNEIRSSSTESADMGHYYISFLLVDGTKMLPNFINTPNWQTRLSPNGPIIATTFISMYD